VSHRTSASFNDQRFFLTLAGALHERHVHVDEVRLIEMTVCGFTAAAILFLHRDDIPNKPLSTWPDSRRHYRESGRGHISHHLIDSRYLIGDRVCGFQRPFNDKRSIWVCVERPASHSSV